MTDLVADAAVWRDRARVADEAAAELDSLARAAARLIRWNYFGRDCVEGQALFNELVSLMNYWRVDMSELSAALSRTASACRSSADAYNAVDSAARNFGGGG